MENRKIGIFQSGVFTFFLTRCFLITGIIPLILNLTKESSLISIFIGTIIGLLPLSIICILRKVQKDKNIFEFIDYLFPKFFSYILKIIILITCLFFSCFLLSNIASYINIHFLKDSSFFIILITITLTIYILSNKKMEAVARSAEILFYLFCFLFILTLLGLIPITSPNFLLPLFQNNYLETFKGSIFYSLSSFLPLFLLTIIPQDKVNNSKNLKKTTYISYILASFSVFILLILIIGALGIDLASYYSYSEIAVLKKVSYFNFIERVEGILSIQWLLDITVSLSILFQTIKLGLSSYKLPKTKIFYILSLLTLVFLSNRLSFSLNKLLLVLFITFFLISILTLLQNSFSKIKNKT